MAEKRKIRFKGHETFTLREGWLNKGLTAIAENPQVFRENYGADALGMGPNMAKALRYWLRCAGLAEDIPKRESKEGGMRLSPLGQIIFEEDRYIEDVFTLWLIHCRIAANYSQATAWNLFFNQFGYEEFDRGRMVQEMRTLASFADEGDGDGRRVPDTSVDSDCDAILHMYVRRAEREGTPEEKNVSPFGRLALIKAADGAYVRCQPDLGRLPEEIVLYLLAESLAGANSAELDTLLAAENGPGKLLQLGRNGLAEMLERLAAKGKLTINRTAGLNMIYLSGPLAAGQVAADYYGERKTRLHFAGEHTT